MEPTATCFGFLSKSLSGCTRIHCTVVLKPFLILVQPNDGMFKKPKHVTVGSIINVIMFIG
jgi:hypothetical protein